LATSEDQNGDEGSHVIPSDVLKGTLGNLGIHLFYEEQLCGLQFLDEGSPQAGYLAQRILQPPTRYLKKEHRKPFVFDRNPVDFRNEEARS
jgi:hypothetical protein